MINMFNSDTVIYVNGQYGVYISPEGKPVEKTPRTHGYSYDPFVLMGDWKAEYEEGIYSDRMMSWYYNKFSVACQLAFGNSGQYFTGRSPEDIEKFLRIYFMSPKLELVKVIEYCNSRNGYPYWLFCIDKCEHNESIDLQDFETGEYKSKKNGSIIKFGKLTKCDGKTHNLEIIYVSGKPENVKEEMLAKDPGHWPQYMTLEHKYELFKEMKLIVEKKS